MNWLPKAAAIVLVALAIFGAAEWSNAVDRYIAASDARMRIGENVGYVNVTIPPVTSATQVVNIGVLFLVRNPSGIALDVIQIQYRFWMDNLTDTRAFPLKANSIYVTSGGFFPGGDGLLVGPHASTGIWANATVQGMTQPAVLAKLNVTFGGNYYPIIDATLVYRIHSTAIVDKVLGIVFITSTGVRPYGA